MVFVDIQLAQQGSLAPLIAALVDKEEVVSRYAAMCVTNLACDPSNQVMSSDLFHF